jgi:myo-inositol 2-dehydrogenase/D-chiro-inositol 1-dehydrogenase
MTAPGLLFLGAGAGATVAAPHPSRRTERAGMSQALQIGLIGAGRIGRLHAENVARCVPGARLAAVADPRLACAENLAADCGAALAAADPRRILDDPAIDAVLICSSTDTHAPFIEQAAAAGKHIFCEKPIDLDLQRIRAALAAVERAGVRLQVGFNRRFDPSFRDIAERVRRGDVGTPHLVRITSRDPQPPPLEYVRGSGGLFLDMTIHDFDMARYLVHDEIVEVHATGASLVDAEIGRAGDIDTAIVTLRYAGGALCAIDNSRRAVYGYDQRVEVFGSDGCLAAGNHTPTQVSWWNASGRLGGRPHDFFAERYRESYRAEIEAFVDAIRAARPPSVSGQDGERAALIGLAALRSLREGRPVRLEAERSSHAA